MYSFTRHSDEKSVSLVVRASVVATFVAASSFLSACQPVQPVASTTEAAGGIRAAETTASPDASEGAGAEDVVADAAIAEVDAPAETNRPDAALVEAGMAVYRAQYCGICHTFTAAGTTGTFGPPHDGMAETAALRLQ